MNDEAEHYLDLAEQARYRYEMDLALQHISTAITLAPNNCAYYLWRAEFYWSDTEEFNLAIEDCTKVIETCSDSDSLIEALEIRASCNGELRLYKPVIFDLERLRQMKPFSLNTHEWLGFLREEVGQFNEGIKDITEGLKNYPDSRGLFLKRGSIYMKISNYDAAIKDYMKVIELFESQGDDIEKALAFYRLGQCYVELERYQDAFDAFTQVSQSQFKHNWPDLEDQMRLVKGKLDLD